MKSILVIILAFALFSFTPTKAQFLGIPTNDDRSDDYVTGIGFVAAADAPEVDYVGYFINPYDTDLTLQSSHSVGIYLEDLTTGLNSLIEQGLVPAGATADSADGSYAFVQLAVPVVLTAGLTYKIISANGNGDFWNGNAATIAVNDASFGTLTSGGYNIQGSSFATTLAPTYYLTGPSYYGGNIAASVPEPSSWAMMFSGLAILVIGLRLRKRSL